MSKELDELVAACSKPEEGCEESLEDLKELAGCVSINLDNIRVVADQHPLVGMAWSQAKGLCARIAAWEPKAEGGEEENG